MRRLIQHLRYGYKILRRPAAGASCQCNRREGYPFIHDRDSELSRNLFSGRHQIAGCFFDLLIDLFLTFLPQALHRTKKHVIIEA